MAGGVYPNCIQGDYYSLLISSTLIFHIIDVFVGKFYWYEIYIGNKLFQIHLCNDSCSNKEKSYYQ